MKGPAANPSANPSLLAALGVGVLIITASGCLELDSFVLNPRHCSLVDAAWQETPDCTERNVCTPCEEPYPWAGVGVAPEDARQVTVAVEGGETVDAWFLRSSGARSGDVIVYAHGNFGGLEHYLGRAALLHQTGAHVWAVDYRGFGKSSTPAEPSEALFMSDARALRDALDGVLEEQGINDARIFTYGFSAGALAAIEMAVFRPPCGLMLEAPFPSVQAFADDSSFIGVPQSFVTTGAWDNIGKIAEVAAPLLHFHGELDETVRIELGEELFAAAAGDKQFVRVKDGTHGVGGNDVPTALGDDYGARVTGFMDAQACE